MQSASFGWRHSLRIVVAMGWSDFFLKYRGSVLGFLWSLAFPITRFLVILHVFRPFTHSIEFYPLYLFLGIVVWEYFSTTTNACIQMLQSKATIIKKVRIPRYLLIFSVGWSHLITLSIYLLLYAAFSLLSGAGLPLSFYYYVPVLILQVSLVAMGIGMILSSYVLRFRDIQHMWTVALQILFWLTPIMYVYRPDSTVLQDAQKIFAADSLTSLWGVFDIFIRFQPLSILIQDARRAMLYPDVAGVPSLLHIAWFTGVCALLFVAGFLVFRNRSRYFIQEY